MERSLSRLGSMWARLVYDMFFQIICSSQPLIVIHFFQEEIFASSFAAAAYLKSIDFPKDKKVCFFPLLVWYTLGFLW